MADCINSPIFSDFLLQVFAPCHFAVLFYCWWGVIPCSSTLACDLLWLIACWQTWHRQHVKRDFMDLACLLLCFYCFHEKNKPNLFHSSWEEGNSQLEQNCLQIRSSNQIQPKVEPTSQSAEAWATPDKQSANQLQPRSSNPQPTYRCISYTYKELLLWVTDFWGGLLHSNR